jgi:hypothetical protein
MNRLFYFSIVGILVFGLALTPAISEIPPTRAFSQIIIAGQYLNATTYNSSFEVITLGNITSSITDTSISLKLKQFSCPVNESITGVDGDGNWICG